MHRIDPFKNQTTLVTLYECSFVHLTVSVSEKLKIKRHTKSVLGSFLSSGKNVKMLVHGNRRNTTGVMERH